MSRLVDKSWARDRCRHAGRFASRAACEPTWPETHYRHRRPDECTLISIGRVKTLADPDAGPGKHARRSAATVFDRSDHNVFIPCHVAFYDICARRQSTIDRPGRRRRARSASTQTRNPAASCSISTGLPPRCWRACPIQRTRTGAEFQKAQARHCRTLAECPFPRRRPIRGDGRHGRGTVNLLS